MNPSPDRGKECLPPKKRESRQGSAERHLSAAAAAPPPADEFKPPVPVRSRPGAARAEGGRDPGGDSGGGGSGRPPVKQNRHVLASPPPSPLPIPAPSSVPLPLPWHVPYPSPLPLFPGHVGAGERRGSGSPSWRDDPLAATLSNHSRWLRGEGPLSLPAPQAPAASSSPSFKAPYAGDSREMWSYFNSGPRDFSSALFSPSQLFGHHPPLFAPDAGLADARDRYLVKRPNGLDGPGGRGSASTSRLPPLPGDYVGDRTSRMTLSPHGPHANGGRRQQEELSGRAASASAFFPGSLPPEGHEMHSSLQDSAHGLMLKSSPRLFSASPNHLGPDPRAERGGLLEALGVPPAEAQIYYSLGSVQQQSGLQPQPQAQGFPFYGPSETPLYTPLKEPALRPHAMGGAPLLFSHRLPSNHDRSQKEPEPDHGRERERESLSAPRQREHGAAEGERLRESEAERARGHDKDAERGGERERERERRRTRDRMRERDRSRAREGSQASGGTAAQPPSPAFLPHFTKGSLIELASGRLKRVEELRTEDFLRSADTSPEFHLSTCTVLLIAPGNAHGFNHLQVNLNDRNTQELLKVLEEYPFFVRDRGWSSCCPPRTAQLYGLPCRQLCEGDVCLALTPAPAPPPASRTHAASRSGSRPHRAHPSSSAGGESSSGGGGGGGGSSSPRAQMPPPPPPPPLLHHHHPHPHHPHHHHPHHHPHHSNHPPPTVPALPPPAPVAAPAAEVQQQPRKRRWSAPDAMKLTGRDESLLDLPQGSKQMKWQ